MMDKKPTPVVTPQSELRDLAKKKGLRIQLFHGWVVTDTDGNQLALIEFFNLLQSFVRQYNDKH